MAPESLLTENTRRTYESCRRQLDMTADSAETFVLSTEAALEGVPLGTAMPIRAAAVRTLVDRFGLSRAEANDALPTLAHHKPAKVRFALSPDQLEAYYQAVEAREDDQVRWALLLLPQAGLRPDELCSLQSKHVRPVGGGCHLEVHGKSKQGRLVPVFGAVAQWLIRRAGEDPEEFIFRGKIGAMSAQVLNAAVTGYTNRGKRYPGIADAVGEPRLTPYVLRHTYGTELRRRGVPLDVIAGLMGHESLDTTRIYARIGGVEFDDAARKVART